MKQECWCRNLKSRLRAAFLLMISAGLLVGLSGCQLTAGNPLLKTISALVPGHNDVSDEASRIKYASVKFTVNGRGGLFVLAQKTRALTFFQAGSAENVMLRNGYLANTGGTDRDLLMTQISTSDKKLPWQGAAHGPVTYTVLRRWRAQNGVEHTDKARARLSCGHKREKRKLPLTTIALERCRETLHWHSGSTTQSTYWRDPGNHRIWEGETVPWPGAPEFHWQVARPWW